VGAEAGFKTKVGMHLKRGNEIKGKVLNHYEWTGKANDEFRLIC
jgi:hypothetical protein